MHSDSGTSSGWAQLQDPRRVRRPEEAGDRKDPMVKHATRFIDCAHRDGGPQPERMHRPTANQDGSNVVCSDAPEALPEADGQGDIGPLPFVPRKVHPTVRPAHWYDSGTMAKAKRRKLRARRSKANHGRKPNAGRG